MKGKRILVTGFLGSDCAIKLSNTENEITGIDNVALISKLNCMSENRKNMAKCGI
jgi:hypothetical protein